MHGLGLCGAVPGRWPWGWAEPELETVGKRFPSRLRGASESPHAP